MLTLRASQMAKFDRLAHEAFVDRVTARLEEPDLAPSTRRYADRNGCAKETRAVANKLIAVARDYDLDAVGDVAPFVILCILADDSFCNDPIYPWVEAVLNNRAYSGEERMTAIYELMPERQRRLCFGNEDRGGRV